MSSIREKRAAFLVMRDYIDQQLATMPPDGSDETPEAPQTQPEKKRAGEKR